jgi:two-component system sensor histidine kinase BarA
LISYRALKKLVGETSLERKCRFLFGIALLLLITASFWLYASRTRILVENQQVQAARDMVPRLLQMAHYKLFISRQEDETDTSPSESTQPDQAAAARIPIVGSGEVTDAERDDAWRVANALRQLREYESAVNTNSEIETTASADISWQVVHAERTDPPNEDAFAALQQFLDPEIDSDEYWLIREEPEAPRTMLYYRAVRAETACLECHSGAPETATTSGEGEMRPSLLGFVEVERSLELVDQQLSRNRAILLASGIVTSFLAMLAAYAIVRYIIVKPVLHLKDVSDEIARGNLNLRAEISTGDEFEELSHAFNRMLRHMMTVNDELRSLNVSLDAKIDQLAQANMELFSNNQLKDEFLATISHELRTPLNSILGFSDILQAASNLDDRQKRYVENIQTSGRSLMEQINDLLDLAKIESGRMEVHRTQMRLSEVIETQVQQVMPLADRKNIDLRIEPPSADVGSLFQDSGKIAQILNNLLSNAIKFTPEGGRIRVSFAQTDESTVEFSVADTGIGIPLQDQEHIFEKFRQGTTAPGNRDHVKREYEGTGLGLSIVRELSRLLGGDVLLESEFGKGSVFVVTLPLEAPQHRTSDEIVLESRTSSGIGKITAVNLLNSETEAPPPVSIRHQSVTASRS